MIAVPTFDEEFQLHFALIIVINRRQGCVFRCHHVP